MNFLACIGKFLPIFILPNGAALNSVMCEHHHSCCNNVTPLPAKAYGAAAAA